MGSYNFTLIQQDRIKGRGILMTFDVDDETVRAMFNGNTYGDVDLRATINGQELHIIGIAKWREGCVGGPNHRTGKYGFLVKEQS